MYRYIYCLLLLIIYVTNIQATSNPSWVTHPSFSATKLTIQINDTIQQPQSVNYTLTKSFGVAPKVALGIIGWDAGAASEPVTIISFNITREKVTGTDIVITYSKLNTVAYNSKFDINVLVVDPSFKHINIAFAVIKFDVINTPSEQQTQEETRRIMLNAQDIQENHEYQIIPFITSINLESGGPKGNFLGVSLTLTIMNETFYQSKFSIDGTNKLSDASFYRILYDKSVTKYSQGNLFIDLNFLVMENNKQTNLKTINNSIKSSLMGFNQFDFSKASKPNFQLQSNTISGQFKLLNISFMQFRTYFCPSAAQPFFDYKNQKCLAECPKGFYLIKNSNTCQICHQTCNSCSGPEQTDCIDCFASRGDALDQETHRCVCNNLVNEKCVKCNQTCLTCDASGTKCTSCNTNLGFVLKDGACVCEDKNLISTEDGVCANCTNLHGFGCLSCNLSQCLSCNQNFTLSSSSKKCVCNQGFTLAKDQGICHACSQMTGCVKCTNLSFCTSCQPKMNLMNGQCFCPSISQFYNEEKKQCMNCRGSCLICQNEDRCLVCRSQKNLVVNSNYQCVCPPNHVMNQTLGICVRTKCQIGYKLQLDSCTQICGDGKVFELECDDGNIADGDGCSSSCQVQKGYKCQNGTPTTPSICRYQNNLKFTLLQSHKLQFQNKIILNFSISPSLQELNNLNFSQLISLNIPYSNITYQYQNTSLILTVQTSNKFNDTQNIKFLFAPPLNNSKLSAMRSSKEQIRLSRNLGEYVQNIVHELSYILKQVFILCSVIAVILCLKRNRKVVSLELISTLQLIYISLCIPSSIVPIYRPWVKVGEFVNGYNMEIQPSVNIQSTLNNIGYFPYFIQNVNCMIAIQTAIFFIGYILFKLGKLVDSRVICKFGRFLYKNLYTILVSFNIVNVGFSFGIDLTTKNKPEISPVIRVWNYVALPIALFQFSMSVFYSSKGRSFNLDQKSVLKQRSIQKRHAGVLMLTKCFIAFLIGSNYSYENIGLIVELLQYLYITYILLASPYKDKSNLYRSLVNEITLIIHFGILYGFVLDTDITTGQYLVFGLINILMIITTTILSVYCHCTSQHLELELVPLVSQSVISSMDTSQRSIQEDQDPDKNKEQRFNDLQIKNEHLFDIQESPQVLI